MIPLVDRTKRTLTEQKVLRTESQDFDPIMVRLPRSTSGMDRIPFVNYFINYTFVTLSIPRPGPFLMSY